MIRIDWSGPLTLHWLDLVCDRVRRGIPVPISEAVEAIRHQHEGAT